MLGAIIGDIVGSRFEFNNTKSKDFELFTKDSAFTDDTVLTIACLDWCLHEQTSTSTASGYLTKYYKKYPNMSYGLRFIEWANSNDKKPYNSFGNGSAMRTSPIPFIYANLNGNYVRAVKNFASATHNHKEGIKGATVVSNIIKYALCGCDKGKLKKYAIEQYPEIATMDYDDLVRNYSFDETCQGTVPQAIYCFLISKDFEDCLRTAISIGGDSDTLACISCSIAEAYYKDIPKYLVDYARSKLPKEFNDLLDKYYKK